MTPFNLCLGTKGKLWPFEPRNMAASLYGLTSPCRSNESRGLYSPLEECTTADAAVDNLRAFLPRVGRGTMEG